MKKLVLLNVLLFALSVGLMGQTRLGCVFRRLL